MEEYRRELKDVTDELSVVEVQIEELLERQNDLQRRKAELESLLKQKATASSKSDKHWDKQDFPWSGQMKDTLKSVFGIGHFRPMQLQTMNVTMSNKDCVLIMPTGGGKSLCFQLPALLSTGITLVVSPLVSLMEDQVMALQARGVDATMLSAAATKETVKNVQDAMTDENATLKLLYVTPEKLSKSKRFMARLEKMYKMGRFARLVIDEVHCCSQWGHDFRPDYKFLGIMKRQFPDVAILGLTATATSSVLEDVQKILNIQGCQLFRASFNRPNLYYEVRDKPSSQKEVMNDIQQLIETKYKGQSGIIYTFSKKDAEDVTMELQSRRIKAGCYHADLSALERSRVHKQWIDNNIHVVVATVAFGMGIDKPDVRFVIHHSLSKSMENLYQESGRAGRDDQKSHCIVYYRLQDVFRQSSMVMAEQTGVTNLYGIVSYCIDVSRCRRSVIARYFGETWDRSQCNNMCDHCNSAYETERKDITGLCDSVVKILDHVSSSDTKLTAIKLLDAWQGKGATLHRVKGTDTSMSREDLERILAYMLVKQYLREDFHFTPYSTISYLVPGPKAAVIRCGKEKVYMDMLGRKSITKSSSMDSRISKPGQAASSQKVSSSDKPIAKPSTSSSESQRPDICVVNKQSSVFSNKAFASKSSVKSLSSKRENSEAGSKGDHSRSSQGQKKRKVYVVSSDSEPDLEFGQEAEYGTLSKKVKQAKGGSKVLK